MSAGHTVYRLYDTNGRLLYIGVCRFGGGRVAAHRRRAPFGRMISRVVLTMSGIRSEALAAEKLAIIREHPAFNVAHSVCHCGGDCPACMWPMWRPRGWDLNPLTDHDCPAALMQDRGAWQVLPLT